MINFYELLGIDMIASKEEINTAYEEIVRKYHFTVNSNDNKFINSLNEVKDILLYDEKRLEYDVTIE